MGNTQLMVMNNDLLVVPPAATASTISSSSMAAPTSSGAPPGTTQAPQDDLVMYRQDRFAISKLGKLAEIVSWLQQHPELNWRHDSQRFLVTAENIQRTSSFLSMAHLKDALVRAHSAGPDHAVLWVSGQTGAATGTTTATMVDTAVCIVPVVQSSDRCE